jgi:uncharacterized membrane protein
VTSPAPRGTRPSARASGTRAADRVTAAAPPRVPPFERFCERHARLILGSMIATWAAVYAFHAWLKYRYYLYTDIDLSIFVQAVDGMLRGTLYSSIRELHWLGDHSSLILFLVLPLYAIARHPVTLPVLQSVALALGAIPVFALARRELSSTWIALGFAALYLLYPALGFTALYEFHPEVLCTSALLAAFAAWRAERFGWTLAWAGLALLGKEDMALPVGAFAIYVLLDRRPGRVRYAAALAGLAGLSLIVSFAVLKPLFSAGEVDYGRMYAQWGTSPGAVARGILSRPLEAVMALCLTPGQVYDTLLKFQYHLHVLAPFLFVPLASPLTLAIALPTLASHMLSSRAAQHTIFYQYTAAVTPFVVAAAVLGARNLLTRRTRAPGGGVIRVRRGPAWLAAALLLAMLAASLLCNGIFGPLTGRARMQLVEANAPSGQERALARERDAMMRLLGRRDSVVAGFEFLSRLAARRNTRTFHHVIGGVYTYSTRPYPALDDVAAVIADLGHLRLKPFADRGTAERFRGLIERNRLGLVAASGDILLYLRDAPDSVSLWHEGESPIARPQRVVFDRQIAFLGDDLPDTTVAPGGRLPLRTFWRRVAPTDSLFMLQLSAYDAREQQVFSVIRHLGYMQHPAGAWPETTMVAETYRMVIPDDMKPGTYMLGMRVGRRDAHDQVLCETDDPRIKAQSYVVELGRFTVTPRP